jgi:hypothetical protein
MFTHEQVKNFKRFLMYIFIIGFFIGVVIYATSGSYACWVVFGVLIVLTQAVYKCGYYGFCRKCTDSDIPLPPQPQPQPMPAPDPTPSPQPYEEYVPKPFKPIKRPGPVGPPQPFSHPDELMDPVGKITIRYHQQSGEDNQVSIDMPPLPRADTFTWAPRNGSNQGRNNLPPLASY